MAPRILGGIPFVLRREGERRRTESSRPGRDPGHRSTSTPSGLEALASRTRVQQRTEQRHAAPGAAKDNFSRHADCLDEQRQPAELLWQDGRKSDGYIERDAAQPEFKVNDRRSDPVLSERGDSWRTRRSGAGIRALPVVPVDSAVGVSRFVVKLPTVLTEDDFDKRGNFLVGQNFFSRKLQGGVRIESQLLESVELEVLANVAKVAGGASTSGISRQDEAVLRKLFSRSLDAIAPYCMDSHAVKNAAQALVSDSGNLYLSCEEVQGAAVEKNFEEYTQASFNARAFYKKLKDLQPLQHWYLPVSIYRNDWDGDSLVGRQGHGLGIGIQKQLGGKVRVSVINSNGWPTGGRASDPPSVHGDRPAFFKSVTVDEASSAMQDLLNQHMPRRPMRTSEERWNRASSGLRLLAWLESVGPAEIAPSADFEGDGQPLTSAPQKMGDCGIEKFFAFIATALSQADYKLAKAACLNGLLQAIERQLHGLQLKRSDAAALAWQQGVRTAGDLLCEEEQNLLQARCRLQQRITSSEAGAMIGAAPKPSHRPQKKVLSSVGPDALRLPNRSELSGQVRETEGGFVFEAATLWRAEALAGRGRKQLAVPYNAPLRPLPVEYFGKDDMGWLVLPRLPAALRASDFNQDGHLCVGRSQYPLPQFRDVAVPRVPLESVDLEQLARALGATAAPPGINTSAMSEAVLVRLFGCSLDAIASQCSDPQAVLNIAQALSKDVGMLYLLNEAVSDASGRNGGVVAERAKASFSARRFSARLNRLQAGQSLFLPIRQADLVYKPGGDLESCAYQSLGLGIRKLRDGNVRVSVINPRGWRTSETDVGPGLRPTSHRAARFKTVAQHEVAQAMENLLGHRMPPCPARVSRKDWQDPSLGQPLLAWFKDLRHEDGLASNDVHGHAHKLISVPLKRAPGDGDVLFAFMATELQQADYKLAKAACLNTLMQEARVLAARADMSSHTQETLHNTLACLRERLTSSWGGVMTAPPAAGER